MLFSSNGFYLVIVKAVANLLALSMLVFQIMLYI